MNTERECQRLGQQIAEIDRRIKSLLAVRERLEDELDDLVAAATESAPQHERNLTLS